MRQPPGGNIRAAAHVCHGRRRSATRGGAVRTDTYPTGPARARTHQRAGPRRRSPSSLTGASARGTASTGPLRVKGGEPHKFCASTRTCGQPRHHQRRPHAAPAGVPCRSEYHSSRNPTRDAARATRSGPKRPSPSGEESGRTCRRPTGGELLVPPPAGCCLMPGWRRKPWWAGAIPRTMYPASTAARRGRRASPSGGIRSSPAEATDPQPRRS